MSPASPAVREGGGPVLLRAATGAQLVATLPYFFGFVPSESVIVLGLNKRRVEAAARMDAAVILDERFDTELLRQRLSFLAPGWCVVVVGWIADEAAAQRATGVVAAAVGRADQTIIVSGGRCRTDGGDWEVYPDAVAEAEVAGLTPLPDRAALAAQVAGASGQGCGRCWTALCQTVDGMSMDGRRQRAAALMAEGLASPAALPLRGRLELAALVRDGAVRDVLWDGLTFETAKRYVELWTAVVRSVPDAGAPAALGLLGMAAWVAGNGALQVCCLERGLALAPEHSLLRLVETINVLGINPKTWAELRRSLTDAS